MLVGFDLIAQVTLTPFLLAAGFHRVSTTYVWGGWASMISVNDR